MRKIHVKDDTVNIWGLKVEMKPALALADKILERFDRELVVTSGRDGIHSPGSYHYYGYAVDIRSREITYDQKYYMCQEMRKRLGEYYDVVAHKTHIHIEYDYFRYRYAMSVSSSKKQADKG